MSRLIVSSLSEDTIAAPGNTQPNYIAVSVTKDDGVPVTGLTAANFKIDAMIVGPGGALVNIESITAGRLPGFYLIQVVQIKGVTWKSGVYIFGIAVESSGDRGQTLASVQMD